MISKFNAKMLRLYLVAGPQDFPDPSTWLDGIEQALKGGVTCLQYRDKTSTETDFAANACKLRDISNRYDVPLIINDRAQHVLSTQADGLHVGQDDLDIKAARKAIGQQAFLGLSVGSLDELKACDPAQVDYIGIGPAFATKTKSDAGQAIGVTGVERVAKASPVPTVAIGGITPPEIEAFCNTTVAGFALVSAITNSIQPYQASLDLRKVIMSVLGE